MNKSKFAKFRKSAIAALCAVAVTCTGLAAACANDGSTGDGGSDSSTPRKEDTQLLKNGNFEYSNVPEGDKVEHLIKSVNSWTRAGSSSGAMSGIINTSETAWEKMTDTGLKAKLDANNDLKPGDSDYKDKHVDYNGMDSGDILYVEPYAASLAEDKIGDNEEGYAKDGVIISNGKQGWRSYWQFLGIERSGDEEDGYTYSFRGETVYLNTDDGDYYFDEDFTLPVRNAIINNPETHYGELKEGESYLVGDEEYKLLVDEDGNYYFDTNGNGEVDVLEDESVGNVLMIHNYPTSTSNKYNGIEQHYTSNNITLEANTAAEISVWVKTSDLKFDRGYLLNGDPVIGLDQQDRGAYIEVSQSVAGHTVDSFKIKAINTEKIIADNDGTLGENESNGWLKYTIYVNACDFADSTITINLGLGGSETDEKITGYAFFDDVEVKKFIDLGDEDCSYSENVTKLQLEDKEHASYCSLISEAEEKIFYADKVTIPGSEDDRFSTRFHYLIDLASENLFTGEDSQKNAIAFDNAALELSTALTTSESSSGKIYASAEANNAYVPGGKITKSDSGEYLLPDSLKDRGGRPTFNDLIGIYGNDKTFTAEDFGTGTDDSNHGLEIRDLSGRLNPSLTGEKGLKALEKFSVGDKGSMLLTLSAYGAAYTTTINSSTLFKVEGTNDSENNYKIISFWIKTSDMSGSTAATIRIKDVADDDNYAVITVDSTKIKTNVGDEEDIYNGWVQCFFFVGNETESDKTFKLEFSFGNTNIENASYNSFTYGWAAMANIQSLDVTEDVYKIISEGTYSKLLTFSEESSKSHTPFDEATRMSNVKKEVGTPSSYDGVNGGSSHVADKEFGDDFDRKNNKKNGITGLINRDGFENGTYKEELRNKILDSFVTGADNWNKVFGEDCYQPLIIVDSLREYYDRVTEDEDYIKEHLSEYYIKNEQGIFVPVPEDAEWDKDETYYSAPKLAKNYGYIANSDTTISSNSYKTVSVKVMVTGDATAWIYLVDASSYEVMTFDIPEYTYYYDDDGNVLKEKYDTEWEDGGTEHSEAIVYTLRKDGLYDGKDGGVYANLSNLTKIFKGYNFEHDTFYLDKNGEVEVSYGDLEDGVTYYNKDGKIANHYLCVVTQVDNNTKKYEKVYEYDAKTETYYYLVKDKRSVAVKDFDHDYARPYNLERDPSEYEYAVEVSNTGVDESGVPKWVNVNFIIHTGNEAKKYRLELWSGKRGETGVTEGMTKDSQVNGAVAFDIADSGITDSNASTVITEYESTIKNIYINLIADADEDRLKSENLFELNINELKEIADELIGESTITAAFEKAGLKDIVAEYYTFSWYDSAQYSPFNGEIAEAGQTGYDYKASSESETLVYFKTFDSSDNSYNVFVDYSAVDQTVSINNATDNGNDDHNHDDDAEGESPWLLITSIVLVVVLLFALVAILVRYLWKDISKKRAQKQMQKNNYKQRERYIRKLGLVKTASVEEDIEEVPAANDEASSNEETPAEEAPTEETPVEEAPAEETPVEDDKKDE